MFIWVVNGKWGLNIEDESPQELLARAERAGLDLRDFAVDDDAE